MTDLLHDFHLSGDSFDVCLFKDEVFFQDFDGDVLPREHMNTKFDFAKIALAQGLQEVEPFKLIVVSLGNGVNILGLAILLWHCVSY